MQLSQTTYYQRHGQYRFSHHKVCVIKVYLQIFEVLFLKEVTLITEREEKIPGLADCIKACLPSSLQTLRTVHQIETKTVRGCGSLYSTQDGLEKNACERLKMVTHPRFMMSSDI